VRFLEERFAEAGERTAFLSGGRQVTYGELLASVGRLERLLESRGVAPGSVVAVEGDSSPEAFSLLLALARRRCVAVPLTPASVVEKGAVLEGSEAGWVARLSGADEAPDLSPTGRVAGNPLLRAFLDEGRPGVILFTSGSSGRPKAILHDLEVTCRKFEKRGEPAVTLSFLMLDHFGGLNTVLAITSALGTLVTVEDRSVESVCRAIEAHRVELLPTTPSFLNLLVLSGYASRFDLGSLRKITYGAEGMPQTTLDRVRALFPSVRLQQTYGLSELGVLRSKSRDDGSLWVRVGGDGFRTRVVDGTLRIKSEFSMVGYLNAPSPFDAEGWYDTRDRVEVDGEWVRFVGRESDVINVGGQKVNPSEVEEVILGLEGVVDVVVLGERHPLLGEVVVARVATRDVEPAEALRRRVRQGCLARLAPFKVPVKVLPAPEGLTSSRMKKRRGA
jgi:acyl-CoA synthetase (AMP-forming)/AMP-acid ligase II